MPLKPPPPIESERVGVRLVVESDLPAMLALNSDPEVTKFLGFAPWRSMADAEAWFQRISTMQSTGSALEFAIVAQDTGRLIGRCGLFEYDATNAQAALGYVLDRAHWRQGLMSEALTALLDCAFDELAVRRIEATVEAPNIASKRLLESLGFTREGVLRERWLSEGEPLDAVVYGLLRHEWRRAQSSAGS